MFECRNYHKRIQNATLNVSSKLKGVVGLLENIFWPQVNFQDPSFSEAPIKNDAQGVTDDELEIVQTDFSSSYNHESDEDFEHLK